MPPSLVSWQVFGPQVVWPCGRRLASRQVTGNPMSGPSAPMLTARKSPQSTALWPGRMRSTYVATNREIAWVLRWR